MLVDFSLLAYIMGMKLTSLQEKKKSNVINVRKKASHFQSFLCIRASKLDI